MPVYLKVAGQTIPTNEYMDSAEDARSTYPRQLYDVWVEKGKIFVSFRRPDRNQYLKTPSINGFY